MDIGRITGVQIKNQNGGVANLSSTLHSLVILSFFILFQRQHKSFSLLTIILMFEAFYSFALIFIACELGERANLAFREIDYLVKQFNSYNFPPCIQKMLPIFLAMTQKKFWFVVFGSITCSRESLKKVSQFVKFVLVKYFVCFLILLCWHIIDIHLFRWSIPVSHILWCFEISNNEAVHRYVNDGHLMAFGCSFFKLHSLSIFRIFIKICQYYSFFQI